MTTDVIPSAISLENGDIKMEEEVNTCTQKCIECNFKVE